MWMRLVSALLGACSAMLGVIFHLFAFCPPLSAQTEHRPDAALKASTRLVGFASQAAPSQVLVSAGQPSPRLEAPSTTLGGTWTATTAAKRTYRGTWSARTLPAAPNVAEGSWRMLSPTNQTMMEGTWSAQKTDGAWQGTWAARVTMGRFASGRTFTGTWQAALPGFDGRTLT